jgi:hypothetical protein
MPEREQQQPSLAEVLDRLLELGANDNPASFRKLAEAARLDPARDFIGASLRNIDMRDEDLRGFDFSSADLAGSDFRRANVQGVRFQNANLEGVIGLRDASLSAPWTSSSNAFTPRRELEQYKVFIGTPGGLQDERIAFRRVLTVFNEHHGELNGIVFEPFMWEYSVGPVDRLQELIGEGLSQCDFAVFVFNERLGIPTVNSGMAGVEEEWLLAQELYEKKVLRSISLFFKQVDPAKLADPGPQLQRVLNFRSEIEAGRKHLYQTYSDVPAFSAALERQLASWAREIADTGGEEMVAQRARALFHDGISLNELGRSEEAIAVFDDIVDRFGTATEVTLRDLVASALVNKGIALHELGRGEQAIAVFDGVVGGFGNASEATLREQAALALLHKGVRLNQLGRGREAIAALDDVVDRFGTASEASFRAVVERARELRARLRSARRTD